MVKATTASKSDDEQAKETSTENDLVATANDSARSLQMGSSRTGSVLRSFGCCKWDRRDDEIIANGIVANRFGVGIIWMLPMALGCCEWAVRERVSEREK